MIQGQGSWSTVLRQRAVIDEARVERRYSFTKGVLSQCKNFGFYKGSGQPFKGFKQEIVMI